MSKQNLWTICGEVPQVEEIIVLNKPIQKQMKASLSRALMALFWSLDKVNIKNNFMKVSMKGSMKSVKSEFYVIL